MIKYFTSFLHKSVSHENSGRNTCVEVQRFKVKGVPSSVRFWKHGSLTSMLYLTSLTVIWSFSRDLVVTLLSLVFFFSNAMSGQQVRAVVSIRLKNKERITKKEGNETLTLVPRTSSSRAKGIIPRTRSQPELSRNITAHL